MKVLVICARRAEPHFITFPMRVFRQWLADLDVHITIAHEPYPRQLPSFDVVVVLSQYLQLILRQKNTGDNPIIQLLEAYKARKLPVVWLAMTDSTGPIDLKILERVEVYALRQLLKDRSAYLQPQYQGIYFKDYYHQQFQLDEKNGKYHPPIPVEYLPKLALYWNLGLIDWEMQGANRLRRMLGMLFVRPAYRVKAIPTRLGQRPIDISYRISKRNQEIVDVHRERVRQAVGAFVDRYRVCYAGKIPYPAYLQEMGQTKIIPSPFGWGEICYRDFEGFVAGALVVKPDMSHLETYPDYYVEDQTYVAHQWDYSDLQPKLQHILNQPEQYEHIAEQGQKRFLDSLQDGAGFAQHFAKFVQQAVQ